MKTKKKRSRQLGTIYLVGAGPGDLGLLTLRAKECLEQAEIIFYDALVNPEMLRFAPQAKLYPVGKRPYQTHISQKQIESLLIAAAKKYRKIVRLKGGDPFIFGRGGEEGVALAKNKIPFEIIPGVTSAIAVPAYAGIPLTHRDYGSSVTLVTGHGYQSEDLAEEGVDWDRLARERTIVFLMGVQGIENNFKKLILHGMDSRTPAAMIEWGTYPFQRTIIGTLRTIPHLVRQKKISYPAVTIVGEIVKLRNSLQWFETRPLFGKKILITRAVDDLSILSHRLRELGAEPVEFPAIEIRPISKKNYMDHAIRQLASFDGLIFTSRYGVKYFFERLDQKQVSLSNLKNIKIAAVGLSTAKMIKDHGVKVDFIPKKFTALDLAKEIPKNMIVGKRILFPKGEKGREDLIVTLKKRGAKIFPLPVYQTVLPKVSQKDLRSLLGIKRPDLILFSSSSQVEHFVQIMKKTNDLKKMKLIPCAVIGPSTKTTAKQMGFKVISLPNEFSMDGVVDRLVRYFAGHS